MASNYWFFRSFIYIVEVILSQFLNSIKDVKNNYTKYDAWEQNQADDAAKRVHLSKSLDLPKDKVELTEAKAKNVIRAAEILDKKSEDNCENTEQSVGIISMIAMLPLAVIPGILPLLLEKRGTKFTPKMQQATSLAQMGLILLGGIGFNLWGTNKQKEASRLGRFQAKQHELKDVKNFITYTPEQIEAAKILAKSMPDKKDNKSITKVFKDMKQMSLDKKEYKKWLEAKLENPDDVEKVLNAKFTPEQIAQGEEDKELIVNIVKDINIEAENYSENMENVADTLTMLSFLGSIPIAVGINKVLKNVKNVPAYAKGFVPAVAGMAFTFGVLLWGTSEQKNASRVGRFAKRKEILSNSKVLMAYTDDQLKQAENIKAPVQQKEFFAKIGGNFKFLRTYLKEKSEYKKYLKTEAKENEKIYDALRKADVSNEQLNNAKHLQEKTFKAFDKVDEMSQRYSEDIEAGTEIAKQVTGTIWSLGAMGVLASIPALLLKGKIPVHSLAKKLSNLALDKSSSIRVFVDKAYEVFANDKNLKENLSKSLLDPKARKRLLKDEKVSKLAEEAEKIIPELLDSKNLINHFKKDRVSKWVRNLVVEIGKFKIGAKIKNELTEQQLGGIVGGEEFQALKNAALEPFKFNYKNYKTLINSLIVGAVPIMGVVFGVPFAFSSWLTNIQKKAGKIGIMKAMDEIDNPKFFVNSETQQPADVENAEKTKLLPSA